MDLLDHVVVDLRKDHLLLDSERVVPAPIERPRVDAAEVTNSRNRDGDEAIEELPHPGAAQRNCGADLLTLPQPEVGDRLLRFLLHRTLSGDDGQLVDDGVENLCVLDRLAHAAVDHDLLERRDLVNVGEAELRHKPVLHRFLEVDPKARWRNRQVLPSVLDLYLLLYLTLFRLLFLFRCHLSGSSLSAHGESAPRSWR